MATGINTFNESSLHKTLKNFYSMQNENSLTEVPSGPYIADIQTADGNIIEIQTANLGKLKEKILYFLQNDKKITVVYPMPVIKRIETTNPLTKKTTKRKSPVAKNIYSVFDELTGLYPILLSRNFYLEVLFTEITEIRTVTEEPVQSKNLRRRYKKNWIKTGKRLDEIKKTVIFHGKTSYKKLLPFKKDETFTIKQLYQKVIQSEPKTKENDLRIMVWLYQKLNLICLAGKEKNANLYKVL